MYYVHIYNFKLPLKWCSSDLSSIVIEWLLASALPVTAVGTLNDSPRWWSSEFIVVPGYGVCWSYLLVSPSRALRALSSSFLSEFPISYFSMPTTVYTIFWLCLSIGNAKREDGYENNETAYHMVDVLEMKFIGNVLEECDVVVWLLVCRTGCFWDLIFFMDLD